MTNAAKTKLVKTSSELWDGFYTRVLLPEYRVNSKSNVARADRIAGERIREGLRSLSGELKYDVAVGWQLVFKDKSLRVLTGNFEEEHHIRRALGQLKPLRKAA